MPIQLEALNLDVLLDHLLPLLSPRDLHALSLASRSFREFILGPPCELLWKNKVAAQFNFPINDSGRTSDWHTLYKLLHTQETAYIWGQAGHGRMAVTARPTRELHRATPGGSAGLALPTPLVPLNCHIVGLQASGWGFHALSSQGHIFVWGAMDGEQWASPHDTIAHVSKVVYEPIRLPTWEAMGTVVQVAVGRKHALARNTAGEVWEYFAFGKTYRIKGPWQSERDAVRAVEAGWECSMALTHSGRVYLWHKFGALDRINEQMCMDGTVKGEIYTVDAETVQLPALPDGDDEEMIVQIACMDHSVIALSNTARLYVLNISPVGPRSTADLDDFDSPVMNRSARAQLQSAFDTGERTWIYLPKFCDFSAINLAVPTHFQRQPLSPATRITHISAHFQSFVAYSVPTTISNDSAVLMGGNSVTEASNPTVIPALQGIGVIKVTSGDHHWGALTSKGRLYTWGSRSSGALGLGAPRLSTLLNSDNLTTPLRVLFPGDVENDDERGKYVFQMTMGGGHSGALVVDLNPLETDSDVSEIKGEQRPAEVENPSLLERGQAYTRLLLGPFISGFSSAQSPL